MATLRPRRLVGSGGSRSFVSSLSLLHYLNPFTDKPHQLILRKVLIRGSLLLWQISLHPLDKILAGHLIGKFQLGLILGVQMWC
jgi:hypothetical protein